MAFEQPTLNQVQSVQALASAELAESRENRLDPMNSPTHPDHWLTELPGYVMSDVSEGNVDGAQNMVRFWLDRITPNGRAPHMVIDDSSWRRRHIDRRVQMADKLENGAFVSPFSGPPVLGSCALKVAEALPETKRTAWAQEVLPKLIEVKRYQYEERDIFDDGLPVQIHPDEVLLRHGRVSDAVLAKLPESKLTDVERFAQNINPLQRIAQGYRRWQGDDSRHGARGKDGATSTYNSDAFMGLDTASRIYTLLGTTRKNNFNARQLAESTGRDGLPDGYIVQDPAITGMLLADNQALAELAKLAGQQLPTDIEQAIANTEAGTAQHWDESAGRFAARLPQRKVLLPHETGIEGSLMLLSLGGAALQEAHVDETIRDALMTEYAAALKVPTARIRSQQEAGTIDRGGFSPSINLLLHQALGSYEGHDKAAVLRQRIGRSIIAAYTGSNMFARQYDSITGRPIGQGIWRPSAAAALVVSHDLLA